MDMEQQNTPSITEDLERDDTLGGSYRTTDHRRIRQWGEERGGRPAAVRAAKNDSEGILRIDFGEPEERLRPIAWEEFFRIFEDQNLEFLYQERTADGAPSRFFRFLTRGLESEAEEDARIEEGGNEDD